MSDPDFRKLEGEIAERSGERAASFAKVDEVIAAFFETNVRRQVKQWTMEDIRMLICQSSPAETFWFRFTHQGQPFLASVCLTDEPDRAWLTLKITNAFSVTYNFESDAKPFSRARAINTELAYELEPARWQLIGGESAWSELPRTRSHVERSFQPNEIRFLACEHHHIVDIYLYPAIPLARGVLISIEPGYPDSDL